jgi:hypothetical protein
MALNLMDNSELNEKAADVISTIIGLIDNLSNNMVLFTVLGQAVFAYFTK